MRVRLWSNEIDATSSVATLVAVAAKTDNFGVLLLPHLKNFKTAFKDLSHVFRNGGEPAKSHNGVRVKECVPQRVLQLRRHEQYIE